jgi:hypothetical protein
MVLQTIIEQYFEELKKEFFVGNASGEATLELSYRTSLDNFFKNIAHYIDTKISTIPEPKNQGKVGRPDWRFHNSESMGVYGYIEAKGIDEFSLIDANLYKEQIKKYLVLGHPVILTDGIDFVLYSNGKKPKIFSLCKKPINWNTPSLNFEIEVLFRLFFKQIGFRKISENQLVNEVAKRARLLTNELVDLLDLDEDEAENDSERQTINVLKQLKSTAEKNHDKSLVDNKTFAGFISQILTFGLLYAQRVIGIKSNSPKEKYKKIHSFWFSYLEENYSNKLIPFKILVTELKNELNSDLSRLGIWYDDIRRLLAHVQLTDNQISLPDFHELYENFLSVYDPKTKFDFGAFYTPRSLAFYTVDLVQEIIKKTLPDIKIESTRHKIIDPCCGTGTFIEAVLEKFALGPNSSIIGFEILPAPYALAHYRMAMLREKYPSNIKIVLTNTLSDNLIEKSANETSSASSLLFKEQQTAYKLSTPPLTIIIGNPPSSDSKFQVSNEGQTIQKLLEDFKPNHSNRTSRQNIQKQLSNEFIKFLRWSLNKATKSKPSIFALILPSSFAKHSSYKFARKYISENISDLWVLEFDTDKRTGAKESNMFKTLQGRLILVGVLNKLNSSSIHINYKNICELNIKEKNLYFESKVTLEEWIEIDNLDEDYSFKPTLAYNKKLYENFWPITTKNKTGIFLRHCSNIKLAPTHLLVHSSEGQLKRRSKFISKAENDYSVIKKRWYSGQVKPPPSVKINDRIKFLLEKAIEAKNIYKYSYRPFLETFVLLDDKLLDELGTLEGGGTRDRPEIRAAYKSDEVFGFAVAPAPEDIGKTLHKFSSFCWFIPDNDLSTRGNAHIFCNYFPEYKSKNNWDPEIKSNMNEELLSMLFSKFNISKKNLITNLTFYSYAILSSNYYLEQFKGKLFNVSGEWPSIPITSDKDLFLQTVKFGEKLAKIESGKYDIDSVHLSSADFEYYNYKIEVDNIKLIGVDGQTIKEYSGINEQVLNFEISGYKVVREWLKMHSFPYYRKKIEPMEERELNILLKKIELYINIIEDLDKVVEQIIKGELLIREKSNLFE